MNGRPTKLDTRRHIWVVALVLWGVGAAPPAVAAQGEYLFGIGPQYGYLVSVDEATPSSHGLGLEASFAYGLDDFWNLLLTGFYTYHPAAADRFHIGDLSVGAVYNIDAITWVPYLVAAVGVTLRSAGGQLVDGSFQVGGGVDYRQWRGFSVGADFKYHVFWRSITTIPAYLTAGVRVSFYWE